MPSGIYKRTLKHKQKLSKLYKGSKNPNYKDGRSSNKKYKKKYNKKYRLKNLSKIKKSQKKYQIIHKKEIKEYNKNYQKKYYEQNSYKIVKRRKKYYLKNSKKLILQSKEYYKKNKTQKLCQQMKYRRKRYKTDLNFRLYMNLRARISELLRQNSKSKSSILLLGCTVPQLKQYLEKQFTKGMTWENYGFYGWHIDHKRPCASFDLKKKSEQKKCFHYTNLQPLWAKDNMSKGDKYYETS